MNGKTVTTNVEILGKFYTIRCGETEQASLEAAADYLNKRMVQVQESGNAINLERIAIITALNVTFEYLNLDKQKVSTMDKIKQHINFLQEKLDVALTKASQTELITLE